MFKETCATWRVGSHSPSARTPRKRRVRRAFRADAAGNLLGECGVRRVEVAVEGNQWVAHAHNRRACRRVEPLGTEVRHALARKSLADPAFEPVFAQSGQVADAPFPRRVFVEVHGHAQPPREATGDRVRPRNRLVARQPFQRYKRHDIHRADARMRPLMAGEVNSLDGNRACTQHRTPDRRRRARKRQHHPMVVIIPREVVHLHACTNGGVGNRVNGLLVAPFRKVRNA
jgi:hypothetical protein